MPGLSYDSKRDAFVALDDSYPEGEQETVFEATAVDVRGLPVKVYGIGAGYWTWDQCEPAEQEARED